MNDGGAIDGLVRALELDPDNDAIRLLLARELAAAGQVERAAQEFLVLLDREALPKEDLVAAGRVGLAAEELSLAARCVELAQAAGGLAGIAELRADLEAALSTNDLTDADGRVRVRSVDAGAQDADAFVEADEQRITFRNVGGLDAVKEAVNKTIILPFQRPDLYLAYGRRAGGGALLYGPPGCGKTLMARAAAGECELPFFNLRIEDVLDPFLGVSERNLHEAFEHVRASSPCLLFIDELDAIAYARRKQPGSAARALVDQLLQELDAIGADNDNVLVLASTNAPWDIDDALKRPGRFDRLLFVPPPDEPAREAILELLLATRPTADLEVGRLAAQTALFSGADLRAGVEEAVDLVIDQAMAAGEEIPIRQEHLEAGLAKRKPTTLDWLSTARNFVEFGNDSGRYDDVAEYLSSREVKRGLRSRKRRGADDRDS